MNHTIKLLILGMSITLLTANASAMRSHQPTPAATTTSYFAANNSHWYVAPSLGVSHLYDNKSTGSTNSVDENGPGWDASLGYQVNQLLGGELGYTQYYNSRETSGSTVVAKTSHFAVHFNATGTYPISEKANVLGKLGIAYSYAQKIFTAGGAAGSAGSVSPYLGLGLGYNLTKTVDLTGQWTFVRGNNYTGSSTLYALGLIFALV